MKENFQEGKPALSKSMRSFAGSRLSGSISYSDGRLERQEKINRLRRLIHEGRYDIPIETVAERMMELHFHRN